MFNKSKIFNRYIDMCIPMWLSLKNFNDCFTQEQFFMHSAEKDGYWIMDMIVFETKCIYTKYIKDQQTHMKTINKYYLVFKKMHRK